MNKNKGEKPGRIRLLNADEVTSIRVDLNKGNGAAISTTEIGKQIVTMIDQENA